jgi:hypothetical protein
MNINRPAILIFWQKNQIIDSLYFEFLLLFMLLQKNSTSIFLHIMKIKGAFVKLVMFDGTHVQL